MRGLSNGAGNPSHEAWSHEASTMWLLNLSLGRTALYKHLHLFVQPLFEHDKHEENV